MSFINSSTPINGTIDCEGHGTACGSIIVGDTPQVVGVAPGAKLRAYQVLTCDGKEETDELMIHALLQAYSDNVDMISWSMGAIHTFGIDPVTQITARIAEKIPIIVSAGNDGLHGPYTSNYLGSLGDTITVGMTVTEQLVTYNATFISSGGNNLTFPYLDAGAIAQNVSTTYNVQLENDLCKTNFTRINSSDTIIIGLGDSCKPEDYISDIQEGGYDGIIALQDPKLLGYLEVSRGNMLFLGSASSELNDWINNETSKNFTIKLFVGQDQLPGAMPRLSTISGAISSMSSWGPTFSQRFFPHIMAPGHQYLVGNPISNYSQSTGTSFACPYVAVVVALYLSTHKNASVKEVRNRLIASTDLLPQSVVDLNSAEVATFNDLAIAPLVQQGAGFVNAVQFFDKKTLLLSEPCLSLNDTKNRISTFTISLRNDDSKEVTYNISNKGFDTVYTRNSTWQVPAYYPDVTTQGPTARFMLNGTIVLKPGQEASFNVTIQPPSDVDSCYAPVFEGAIIIQSSNNETVRVSYIGSQYNVYEWLPFDEDPFIFYNTDDELLALEDIDNTLSVPALEISSLILKYQLRFGSTVVAFALVEHDFQTSSFSPSSSDTDSGFNETLIINKEQGKGNESAVFLTLGIVAPTEGKIIGFGENVTVVPGHYRVLAYALKAFGNRDLAQDYQLRLSKDFKILAENGTQTTNGQSSSLSTRRSGANYSSVSSWMAAILLLFSLFAF